MARHGVYFEFANAFVPLMTGGDPYSLARAFMEDNAPGMLGYITAYACFYYALQHGVRASTKSVEGLSAPEQQLLDTTRDRILRPFKVSSGFHLMLESCCIARCCTSVHLPSTL